MNIYLFKYTQAGIACIVSGLILSACSSWPSEGAGGFAEHNAAPYQTITINSNQVPDLAYSHPIEVGTKNHDINRQLTEQYTGHLYYNGTDQHNIYDSTHHPHNPSYNKQYSLITRDSHQHAQQKHNATVSASQGLRIDTHLCRNTLDTLILQGAKMCFPAAVHNTQLRQNRIERELAGGLIYDASLNIQIQHFELDLLRQQVNTINPSGHLNTARCIKPLLGADQMEAAAKKSKEKNQHLLKLLNTDNQFATNSSALNPKYAARLAKASQLLNQQPQINLIIKGHTDNIGDEQYNKNLALERAQAVAQFLHTMGIALNRLKVIAFAASQPYSHNKSAEHRLVNRRVDITLANADSSAITVQH
ncbi:OmpA family protein [Marinagarivorans algicola]|uniref:OmpA family protein n=1 Tax=Marinagarivorans algicola TaxID=1513270 RepID=UPI0006B89AB5|nr:OmpA family protein [Marinagarivorans algicola]